MKCWHMMSQMNLTNEPKYAQTFFDALKYEIETKYKIKMLEWIDEDEVITKWQEFTHDPNPWAIYNDAQVEYDSFLEMAQDKFQDGEWDCTNINKWLRYSKKVTFNINGREMSSTSRGWIKFHGDLKFNKDGGDLEWGDKYVDISVDNVEFKK